MTDIAPETNDVSLDRVVAAVETVSIDAEDKENEKAAAAIEQNTPDCDNKVNNTSEEEEKQGWSFLFVVFNILFDACRVPEPYQFLA
jgi:hypothetical protein